MHASARKNSQQNLVIRDSQPRLLDENHRSQKISPNAVAHQHARLEAMFATEPTPIKYSRIIRVAILVGGSIFAWTGIIWIATHLRR